MKSVNAASHHARITKGVGEECCVAKEDWLRGVGSSLGSKVVQGSKSTGVGVCTDLDMVRYKGLFLPFSRSHRMIKWEKCPSIIPVGQHTVVLDSRYTGMAGTPQSADPSQFGVCSPPFVFVHKISLTL